MPAEVTDSTKQVQAPEQHIAQQNMAADNQQGPSAAHVSDMSKASTSDLVQQKVLPDTQITHGDAHASGDSSGARGGDSKPMPPTDGQNDVLSAKDSAAIHDAKAKGQTINEKFYQNVSKSNAGLGDFQAQDGKANSTSGAANAVDGSHLDMTAGEKGAKTRGLQAPKAEGQTDSSPAAKVQTRDTTTENASATVKPENGGKTPEHAGEQTTPPKGDGTTPRSAGDQTTPPKGDGTTPHNAGDQTTPPKGDGTTPAAADKPPVALQHSDRLNEKPNGSGEVTVKPHDNLWRIASESLKQNHPEGYKPSNQEIQRAVTGIAKENHLSNPNMIRDGQKIKIPEGMIKQPSEVTKPHEVTKPQEAGKAPEVGFENHNASPEFAAKVQQEFKSLPENVQKLLANNGTKLVVGGKMSDADPSLKGVTPRGWSPGSTWDDDDGEYDAGKKAITIAETSHDGKTDTWQNNDRMPGGLRHETGHAVDAAMGNVSHGSEFKQAYDKDVANMSPQDKEKFKYLLQNGQAGHEETFAEVFGANNGSSANADQTQRILQDFPSVSALIKRKQDALPN
jgi:hypothetical protein